MLLCSCFELAWRWWESVRRGFSPCSSAQLVRTPSSFQTQSQECFRTHKGVHLRRKITFNLLQLLDEWCILKSLGYKYFRNNERKLYLQLAFGILRRQALWFVLQHLHPKNEPCPDFPVQTGAGEWCPHLFHSPKGFFFSFCKRCDCCQHFQPKIRAAYLMQWWNNISLTSYPTGHAPT